jgi:hypothetical protein
MTATYGVHKSSLVAMAPFWPMRSPTTYLESALLVAARPTLCGFNSTRGRSSQYGKVWCSPYLEFLAILFLKSLSIMNRLGNMKFCC